MAWSYLVICLFDFIGGPLLNAAVAYYTDTTYHDWNPLTLRGGGLYHMAMAAIIGLATWSRGAEKQIILKGQEDDTDENDDKPHKSHRDHDRNDDKDDKKEDDKDDNDSRHKGDDA